MFERFTREARQIVVDAQAECRRLHDSRITSVHLMLALAGSDAPLGRLLAEHGITRDGIDTAARAGESVLDDRAANDLRRLGIDLDAVREAVESNFGPGALDRPAKGRRRRGGHLPFTADAKKALELSLREALRLQSKEIRVEHLALGLLRTPGAHLQPVLDALAVDVPALRGVLERRLRSAA